MREESSVWLGCLRVAAAAGADEGAAEGAPREPVTHLGAARAGQGEAGYYRAGGRETGKPGQRGKPRGARPGRAPRAAQDAPRGAADLAETPLWL